MTGFRILAPAVLVAAVLLPAVPEPALAQCAMCRTALEQNPEAAASFNRGIIFLLGMPYLLFGAGALFVLRRSRARRAVPAPRPHREPRAAADFAPAGS